MNTTLVRVTGEQMANQQSNSIDFNKHTVWLSTVPYEIDPVDKSICYTPEDSKFIFLGGNTSFSYKNNYGAQTMGIYSKGPEDAYFIDAQTGSVSTISVSTVRVQEEFDDSLVNCSNQKVVEVLRSIRGGTIQLKQGAYILRLYNSAQGTYQDRTSPTSFGIQYDFPVFLSQYSVTYDMENPFQIQLNLEFTRRSPVQNQNIGTTVIPDE